MKCRTGADNAAAAFSLLYALVMMTDAHGYQKPGFFEHLAAGYAGQTEIEQKHIGVGPWFARIWSNAA